MNEAETMSYIQGFSKSGKAVTNLSRITALLEAIGNPQDSLQVIHIAGTNGKGSTLAYCAMAAREAGFCVGQFTSPFVRHYADRIQVNGEDIPMQDLCELCEIVRNSGASADCSQFEITFAIALLYFVRRQCDLVFLETGIGGTLDATNIVQKPLVCVITSISYDHTAILGKTLPAVAAHKAGIIKPGCPVVLSADNPPEVAYVVQKAAEAKQAPLIQPSMRDCVILSETLQSTCFQYHCMTYTLSMTGRHQVYNALTAIEVIRILGMHGFLIPASAVSKALAAVQVPGRTQLLQLNPPVILDGSHNRAGIMALVELLQNSVQNHPLIGICGMLTSKDYTSASAVLGQVFQKVLCVDGFMPNAVPREELAGCFPKHCHAEGMELEAALPAALQWAKEQDGMAVICGSLYLASVFLQDGKTPL